MSAHRRLFLVTVVALVACSAAVGAPKRTASSREKTSGFVLPLYPESYSSDGLPGVVETLRTHTEYYTRMGGGYPLFVVHPASHAPGERVLSALAKASVREHLYLTPFDDGAASLFDFLAGGFLTVPELQHLEWLWLLYPGAKYVCPFAADPFAVVPALAAAYVWSSVLDYRPPPSPLDDTAAADAHFWLQSAWRSSHWRPADLPARPGRFALPDGLLLDPSFELLHLPTFRDGGYLAFYQRARPPAPQLLTLHDLCILRTAGVALFVDAARVYQSATLAGHSLIALNACYQACATTYPGCAHSQTRQQLFRLLGAHASAVQPIKLPSFDPLPLDIAPDTDAFRFGFTVDDDLVVFLVACLLLLLLCLMIVTFVLLIWWASRPSKPSPPSSLACCSRAKNRLRWFT